VKSVQIGDEKGEIDFGSRLSDLKLSDTGLRALTLTFPMLYLQGNAHFEAVRDAYDDDTEIELLFLTGDVGDAGEEGVNAICKIMKAPSNEELEEGKSYEFEAKPTLVMNGANPLVRTPRFVAV